MPTAILFPGQGSHTPDMADRTAALRPDLLALTASAVGEDPFPRAGESTRYAQPAIFCASLAALEEVDEEPVAMAGHSLGELTAFVAAGAIAPRDGVRLVALRGRLMAQAPAGAMLAVLGADRDDLAAAVRSHGVVIANDNAPGQMVLSGDREGLRRAAERIDARTVELPVRGAFHSPLMSAAVGPFAAALAETPVVEPAVPVHSCVTAAPVEDPDEIRRVLADGLTRPVRWRETVLALHDAGIDRFVEAGPGRVLSGLVKRIVPAAARV